MIFHFTLRCKGDSLLTLQLAAARCANMALQRTATDDEQIRLELRTYGGKNLEF